MLQQKNFSLHTPMAKAYSQIMQDPSLTPECLVEGTTNLLPKKEETWIPKNYRLIACLPTTFKILTSVITDRLYNHLEKESIMTPEQRGGNDQQCHPGELQKKEEEPVYSLD